MLQTLESVCMCVCVFRFVKELQPSVLDTMTIWYLGIIGSTAKVAMPIAPQLRNLILSQSG